MKRILAASVAAGGLAVLTAAGCAHPAAPAGNGAGTPAAPAPGPVVMAETACAPTPESDDFDAALQTHREREANLIQALEQNLQGRGGAGAPDLIRQTAPCATVRDLHSGPDSPLVITLEVETGIPFFPAPGLLAWQHQDRWRFFSLIDQQEFTALKVLGLSGAGDSRQAVMQTVAQGTGGYAELRAYRLGAAAELDWTSPVYEKFWPRVLTENLILVTYRAPADWQLPHLNQGNCCVPINGQSLWQRQGDQWVERAARIISSPYRTVSLFAGALAAGDGDLLSELVANEMILQTVLKADGSGYEPVTPADNFDIENEIWEAEAHHWDALPAELRGPAPEQTRVVWPASPLPIVLERIEGVWKVTGWENPQ